MSMSVSSGFAVIPKPNFEGLPPLVSSSSFSSRQGNSPSSFIHGHSTPLSLAQRSPKSLGAVSAFEDDDDEPRSPSALNLRETRSSSLVGWYGGGSEDANLSPRRFSLFHPTAVASQSQPLQQRGSNQRIAATSQSNHTCTSAANKISGPTSVISNPAPSPSPPVHPPSQPSLPPTSIGPPSLCSQPCSAGPRDSMRSVTPPPSLIDKQVDEVEDEDDGWVSISTVNMSPFMVLRIKALIELASVEPSSDGSDPAILLKVVTDEASRLKPCLKPTNNICDEVARLERARFSMDPDECYITLLNDLLETARQRTSQPSLAQINEAYNNYYRSPRRSASAGTSRPRLSFSEGASLLCFDSSEKPRRVKDNHKRHFAKFLSYQRSSSVSFVGVSGATSSLMGVPKASSPPPLVAPSMPGCPSLSPQMPSPSSNSTQTPPPSPAPSQMSSGSSTPSATSTTGGLNGGGAVGPNSLIGAPTSPPSAMPPLRPLAPNGQSAPRHVSPRLTEAFVSSIASNTSASAAVLASVLQGEAANLRVYGQTVKAPPKPLTSLLQRQMPRRLSASATSLYTGGASRTA